MSRWTRGLLCGAMLCLGFPEVSFGVDGSPRTEIAQGKKKKKKKKKKRDEGAEGEVQGEGGEAGEGSGAAGSSIHAKQGDGPYRGLLTASTEFERYAFGFLSNDSTTTPEEGDEQKSKGTSILISAEYLVYVANMIGLGPRISYLSTSSSKDETSVSSTGATTTESVTAEFSQTGVGLAARLFLADLDRDALVPFVGLAFLITKSEVTSSDFTSNGSGTRIELGGGITYFLVSHVGLNIGLSYAMTSETNKSKSESTSGATGATTTFESESKEKGSEFGLGVGLTFVL